MKRLFVLFILSSVLFSFAGTPKVLLFIKDGSPELDYMLINEVGQMKALLERSGFKVTIATATGEALKGKSTALKPDIKLSKININDYAGFIFPCMAAGDSVQPGVIDFAKKIAEKGKPIAAQLGSVLILAKAGALKGKRFAFADEKDWSANKYPELIGSIHSGTGVIQDGNIITSGICPWMAKAKVLKDGTTELTLKLIEVMNKKKS